MAVGDMSTPLKHVRGLGPAKSGTGHFWRQRLTAVANVPLTIAFVLILGGSNRMLSARDVAAILAIPERTIREKWREWQLPAYRIGKHLRWKERDVYAWIDRHAA